MSGDAERDHGIEVPGVEAREAAREQPGRLVHGGAPGTRPGEDVRGLRRRVGRGEQALVEVPAAEKADEVGEEVREVGIGDVTQFRRGVFVAPLRDVGLEVREQRAGVRRG